MIETNHSQIKQSEIAPMNKQTAKPSLYDTVTDRILDSLKQGFIPWEKPWSVPVYEGGNFPRNFRTGKPYRGINVMLLWSTPFALPFWLTFKQAQELGGTVRKGEKGTAIVFYKQLTGERKNDEEAPVTSEESGKPDRSPFVLTSYTVFNVEQCDGLKIPELPAGKEMTPVQIDDTCEAFVKGWQSGPTLALTRPNERRAAYCPATDTVHMPARFRFLEPSLYYSTLFHELVHSTGHPSRLNRTFGLAFGDELYSKEELVAEMGAAFLCALTGIANQHSERNTTAYLQNWIERLQADNRIVLHAATAAQKAVDLMASGVEPATAL